MGGVCVVSEGRVGGWELWRRGYQRRGLNESVSKMRMDYVGPAVIDFFPLTEVTQLLDVEDKFQLKIISACNLNVGKDALVSTSTPPSHTTHPLLTYSLPTLPPHTLHTCVLT